MVQTVEGTIEVAELRPAPIARAKERTRTLDWRIVVALIVLCLCGAGLRGRSLGAVGFAEDETNKLEAVRAYGRGDITQNAEHPMLMKTLIFVSFGAGKRWNAHADAAHQLSDEAALRLPNALFGALTVVPLFLLTAAFFERKTGLIAATFWAFGVNAITYNRIGKEDTLLVFFMLFAFYFYLRAKQTSGFAQACKNRYYGWSAISFGLMLAAKYFPHYFGLNMLYHHLVQQRERKPGEPAGRTPRFFYLLLLVPFVLANFALFWPRTWHYLDAYSGEKLLTHHGYLMGDTLYQNLMSQTPFGTPAYFYALYLAIKTPLPLLVAFLIGLFVCVRSWRKPGPAFLLLMFILWIVPYSLVGAKWLRYVLSLLPLVYMIGAVGVMAIIRWGAPLWSRGESWHGPLHGLRALVLIVFLAVPAWLAFTAGPHYALYTNALGAGRAGYYFPHDEFYDAGLREAIKFICAHAPPGATIAHETPGVVRYYLQQYGRTDLQSCALSDPQFDVQTAPRPVYFILQRGRTYFENRAKMAQVRAQFGKPKPAYEGFVDGLSAVEVYVAQ
ncbi:MAG: ArnT family glycosyltransferase [Pyrinomonadaceae bacterium]